MGGGSVSDTASLDDRSVRTSPSISPPSHRFEPDFPASPSQSDDAVEVTRRQIRTLGVESREGGRKVEGGSDWGERATSVVEAAEGVVLHGDGTDKARLL